VIMLFLSLLVPITFAAEPVGWTALGMSVAGPPLLGLGAGMLAFSLVGPPPASAQPYHWDAEAWRRQNRIHLAIGLPSFVVGLTSTLVGPPVLLSQGNGSTANTVGWGLYGAMWGALGTSVVLHARTAEPPASYWLVPALYVGSLVAGAVALKQGEPSVQMVAYHGVF